MDASGGVLVVGGGGHALVAVEVLRAGGHRVAGALTREGLSMPGLTRLGVSVLGTDDRLADRISAGGHDVFIAVGDNRTRHRLIASALSAGATLVAAISPHAVVSASASISPGALVMPGAVINALTVVRRGAIVNTNSSVDHECDVGECAHIAPGAALAGDVRVGEGALLGIGSSVVPGRSIGRWAVVGAGSAVTCDVADEVTVAGVPARVVVRS